MGQLIHSFSLPWWFWLGFGVFLTLFVVKPAFRNEIDAVFARMLGMRPKQRHQKQQEKDE